ncbi:protein Wnt-7b-like [Dendronephthya gigantea]|uniref:protein Wnt-7b-like n=1 Tax=Dendronephthya gigantea TaxID=151771 RepID=UPI00106C6918|nr:protein Wnt-7b-like [Dendronephthya gigantea]
MATNGRSSHRPRFLHALLIAVICVSVFYVSDGNKTTRKRSRTRNAHIRRYCRVMSWFDKRQRSICMRSPDMIKIVERGVRNALTECRKRFKDYRWNCSPLTWNQVFEESGILKRRSRETAFVQALTSASVMVEVAKACATQNYKHCGCGNRPKHSRRKMNRASQSFSWGGCPDNMQYGTHFTKRFMDPKKINNHARKTKSHNQEVGRKIVRQLKTVKCKCHGKSDQCTHKTCWHVAPDVEKVGEQIWQLYKNSIRSQWNKTTNVLYDKDRSRREKGQEKLDKKLTYFAQSENFCVQNLPMGIMGTYGRTCNSTSLGNDGCDTMCCGRTYKRTMVTKTVKCNCQFVWCCRVDCELCNKTEVLETCL